MTSIEIKLVTRPEMASEKLKSVLNATKALLTRDALWVAKWAMTPSVS